MPTEPELPLSSDLLAHASALRRLASGILADHHAAEDVVQETWVRALERPPARADRPEGVRGWLSAVARTLAFRRVRGEVRRGAREGRAAEVRASDAALGASTAEIVERRQALARLTAAVLALEEPYQSAILLRFYDDLPPRAVAERLGVPVATVKSRIARGLQKLRERVEHDLAADGTTPRRAFAFLVGPALPVAPLSTSQATSGGAAAATAGAIAMGINGKIAAGIAAAALLGFATYRSLARTGEPARPDATARAEAAARPDVELAGVDAPPLATAGEAEAREPLRAAAPDRFVDATEDVAADPFEFTLVGLVVDENDLPPSRAQVYVGPLGAPRNRAVETDADGRFRITWRGPASTTEIALCVHGRGGDASGMRRLRVGAGTTEVAMRVTPSAGSTLVAGGETLATELIGTAGEHGSSLGLRLTSTIASEPAWAPDFAPEDERSGHFSSFLERCPSGSSVPQGFRQYSVTWSVLTQISVLESGALEIPGAALEPPAFALTGVAFADGEPAGDVLVVLGSAPGRGDGLRTTTAQDGTFAFDDVPPGLWFARAGGGDRGRAELAIDAAEGGTQRWEAFLDRGQELRGRLVDAATGAPLEQWSVDVAGDAPAFVDGAITDAEGRFAIPNVPRRGLAVLARRPDAPRGLERMLARGVFPGGDELVFEVDTTADVPRLKLAVENGDGGPVAAAEVRLWNLDTDRGTTLDRTDDGFELRAPLPPSTYALEALVPGRQPIALGPMRLAGAAPVDLGSVRVAEHGAVRILEDAADEAALERWLATLWLVRDDARILASRTVGALPKRMQLAAGRYELDLAPNPADPAVAELSERGRAPEPRRLAFEVTAGGELCLALLRGPGSAAAAFVEPPAEREAAVPQAGVPDLRGIADRRQLQQYLELQALTAQFQPRTSCTNCH